MTAWKTLEDNAIPIRKIVERFSPFNIGKFDTALKDRNKRVMLRILNDAWWNVPSKPEIHQIPGWSVLCDLCSENMEN